MRIRDVAGSARAALLGALVLLLGAPAIGVRAQSQGVTTTIEVTLDLFSLDTDFLDEPFRPALRSADQATLLLSYPPFDWEESHVDPPHLRLLRPGRRLDCLPRRRW